MTTNSSDSLLSAFKDYKWYNSLSLPLELQCGVRRLELPDPNVLDTTTNALLESLYITAKLVCNQTNMVSAPVSTRFSSSSVDESQTIVWDSILSLPIKIRDLTLDSVIAFTAWAPDGTAYGGTTLTLFDEKGTLKMGKQKLMFYFDAEGDTNVVSHLNTTPGETYDAYAQWDYQFQTEKRLETFEINHRKISHNKDIAANSSGSSSGSSSSSSSSSGPQWLDRSVSDRLKWHLGQATATSGEDNERDQSKNWGIPLQELYLRACCFLVVELPTYSHKVLHEEKQYKHSSVGSHAPPISMEEQLRPYMLEVESPGSGSGSVEFSLLGKPFDASLLTIVEDWDMEQENLCEELYRRLYPDARRGTATDANAKPNLIEKQAINKILQSVSSFMSTSEMELIYKFRFALTENKKALIKFLYTVRWDEEIETREVPELLSLWKNKSSIDVADALKLLSKDKSFAHPYVRSFAVEILQAASDEELLTFLLQLVQALRYEPAPPPSLPPEDMNARESSMSLSFSEFSLSESQTSRVDFNAENGAVSPTVSPTVTPFSPSSPAPTGGPPTSPIDDSMLASGLSPLANFLIRRSCKSTVVANYLYWYLKVEGEDELAGELFQTVFEAFIVQLSTSGVEGKLLFKRLMALDEYISKIAGCQRDAREQGKRREGKQEFLRRLLLERRLDKIQNIQTDTDWVPMPLDPTVKLNGLTPSTASMFASAVYPCVIEFHELGYVSNDTRGNDGLNTGDMQYESNPLTRTGSTPRPTKPTKPNKELLHKIMFKAGDDLRQDQLVMQMISLMDRLLKKVNLDLKLLTYGILATGPKDGIMEFCKDSAAVSGVLKKHGTIAEYLRVHNPDAGAPYGVAAVAMDTFVKSCAGSCVVTYILGIGDRHLDNIMVNTSGQMFHIDFGFIFGQDPKPLPPPFRLTRAMVDCMGGEDSQDYVRFKTYCCQAYNWLRKSASLILNLLSLMGDAGIQDISKRSDLPKVLMKVEEKFRLDLTDEQAEQFFLGLVNESLNAIAPRFMEKLHEVAVSLR